MFSLLFDFELSKIKKFYKTKKLAKAITSILFIFIFIFIALGIFLFLREGFLSIKYISNDFFRSTILLYLNEIFLIILSIIILFSAFIQCIFLLFRSQNDIWLMSTPAYKIIPNVIFTKVFFSSLWPFFLVFLPASIAIKISFNLCFYGFFFILFSFLMLLLSIVTFTMISIILVGFIYYKLVKTIPLLKFNLKIFISIYLSLIIFSSICIWNNSINKDFIELFKANQVVGKAQLFQIEEQFKYLPTNFVAKEIFYWQTNDKNNAITNHFISFLISFILILAWMGISYFYYPLWQRLQETNYVAEEKINKKRRKRNLNFYGTPFMALIKKEYLNFVRNGKTALWFVFLLFIWLTQTGINFMLKNNINKHQLNTDIVLNTVVAIQFITFIYFITAFTLRFVFPSFSSEKKTLWILAHSPINNKRYFYSKLFFYLVLFIILGLIISIVNLKFLNISPVLAIIFLFMAFLSVIFIVTLGLSLGAIFPNYETDDPGIISTSLPGIVFIFVSLLFSAFGGYIIYISASTDISILFTLFILITTLSTITLSIYAPNTLKNRDFINTL